MQTDFELWRQMKADDEAAFTQIYNRYWDVAYKAAFNLLRDEQAAMDIVQDVFIWLWHNKTKLQISCLKAYILTAVKFKVLNVIRQGKFRDEILKTFPAHERIGDFTDLGIEVKELKTLIAHFTDKLPEQARKIFHLSRNEHLSHKAIAEQLGISEKTVKNQMNISLKKLRSFLGRMSFWMYLFFM
ncbi:RNA polymerase sigma-70 factor [Mucilaginibacter sabulilitoris]|uniref:RNA polymerase sigma-70 factor n=1 Tax=Mucilaginibacter sabulilitoris TaxID=1173583 RepID=A0ABZ0TPJ9_9SPHI|nr:RNA polymerase sigma-70 factor [Mucilaginibacter sabulilitoris]WPU94726.1 RNA polymerase sigma-70 factor [Mucilaginibacter sabulilitoris]